MLSFIVGMIATALAYPTEKYVAEMMFENGFAVGADKITLLFLWALVEEVLKYGAIFFVALRSKFFDEPIDAVIYFITVALGFAALENAMFLVNPLGDGDTLATILLGNFRFVGATLLHVAASAIVGVALAATFYGTRAERAAAQAVGLVGAVVLHTAFNYSIIKTDGMFLYEIFMVLWALILVLLFACERIKRMAPRSHVEHPRTGIVVIPRKDHA